MNDHDACDVKAMLAREACQRLCLEFAQHADTGAADALAALFVENGVMDRPGQIIQGREAIRALIASRPADTWTRHYCSNIRIDIAPGGQSASGQAYLQLFRGQRGAGGHETVLAEYHDTFTLTLEGWRFRSRRAVLVQSPA